MSNNPYEQARWDAVLGADPLELVVMLYRGAIDSVRAARRHLDAGDIVSRSREISRAMEIIVELSTTLDRSHQSELTGRLAALYVFIFERLREGNAQQTDGPLAEAQNVLEVLAAAWAECEGARQSASEGASVFSRCA